MGDKPRLGIGAPVKPKEGEESPKEYNVQYFFDCLHCLFMQVKISHYKTRSYAAHEAFDRTFNDLLELLDKISEQMIGYSGEEPEALNLGIVQALSPADMGSMIVNEGEALQKFGEAKGWSNIENLAQELSGIGATLKYLSRFV